MITSSNGNIFCVAGPWCEGNSPITGEFPSQRPVTLSYEVFFDLRMNKRLNKPSRRPWFETPSRSLCRHCNADNIIQKKNIERHTTHTIVSWPNPKQWVIVHNSDLMIIRQSIYILSIITKEMGKLKTHRPTYCIIYIYQRMCLILISHTRQNICDRHFYKFNVVR